MPPVLYFFALCNLVIGSGAFVLGGILEPMSESLNISVAAAGQAMTAYATATAVLAPLLIILTARWTRKRAVQLALLLFATGCLLCALAPSLTVLLLGRVLMGAVISGALLGTVGFARLAWVGMPFGLPALLTLAFDLAPASAAPSSSSAA